MLVDIAVLVLMILLLVLALVPLSLIVVWVISQDIGVPFVRTPGSAFPHIVEALEVQENDVVYELGSGDGGFLLYCAKRYPAARFVGVELNPLLHAYARTRWRFSGRPKNLSFRKEDIFESDFSGTDKIYAYLLTPVMAKLLPRLGREFKGRFVSRAFQFADKKPSSTIKLSDKSGWHGQHLLYVYDF